MKDLKFLLVLLMLWFFGFTAIAQTELYLSPVSVNTETTFNLTVNLDNIEDVKAVQFDLNVDPEAILLDSGHTLTQRAPDHSIAVNNVSPGVFRVIVYSMSGSVIIPGTGSILNLSFVSKTLPGNFTGTFSNIVTSDINGEAVNTTSQSAMITVTGPLMDVVTKVVDFGRVPKGDNPTRTVNISNRGNQTLTISAVNEIAPFSIQQTLPINIAPGQTTNLTLNVNSSEKQQITRNLSFSSNDADPLRALQKVAISADVYAVNEIIVGSGSGEINTEISIPVMIKNMEPFTGFQFDITLPQNIAYVSNSISSTLRSNGHSFSANVINGNTLRFIAYSGSNNLFSGNDGEIFSFNLKPLVSSGIYSLPVSNAIISHPEMGDILSDTYAGSIEIQSPSLSVNPSNIALGNVPITETRTTNVTFSNYGSSSLIIDTILYDQEQLTIDVSLPLEILPGANKNVSVTYLPNQTGNFSRDISIRHNGASEQNILQVSANAFSPNFLLVPNQQVQRNTSGEIEIDLVNHAPIKAIQFDMDVPAGFTLDLQNILKTERINNFSVSASEISPDKFRFVIYSSSGSIIPSGNSSILNLPVYVAEDVNIGTYTFNFTNLILSNSSNENTASIALDTGSIEVVDDVTAPNAICKNVIVELDETGNASITADQIDNGSNDASGIASMEVNPSSFTTANLGDNSVTLSITDNNGNLSTCLSTVTIVDNISPRAVCQNLSVVLNETGQVTITAEQVDNGSSDASGITSLELSKYSFTTDNIGDNLITLTVTDNEGNSSVCNSTINVTAPPANYILVKSKEALLDQTNNIELQLVNAESIKAIQFDIDLPSGFNLDTQNVSGTERVNGFSISVSLLTGNKYRVLVYSTSNYTIPAGSGTVLNFPVFLDKETAPGSYILDITGVILSDIDNQDASTAPQETGAITVSDTIAPTAVCKNISLELDVNGNATVTPGEIDAGSSDNTAIATMEVSPNSFTAENVGDNIVTLTVTDTSGNVSSCTAVITINENSFVSSILYRVNSGGPAIAAIDGGMDWVADTRTNNSSYLSEPAANWTTNSSISSYTNEVDLTTTPTGIFDHERFDNMVGAPNMTYSFPVSAAGTYEVRLYMGNTYSGTSTAGRRIFDVSLEGIIHPELDDIDLSARFGHQVGGMISRFVEVTDGLLDVSFLHGTVQNPLVNGIEILKAESVNLSSFRSDSNYLLLKDQRLNLGETNELEIQLLNDENIRAVQFDIKLPSGIELDIQKIKNTERLNNFSISTSYQGANLYRIIAYPLTKNSIPPGTESIITIPTTIGAETNLGTHSIAITSVLLSNMNNIDISTNATRSGEISVIDNIAPSISCRDLELELLDEGTISITAAQIDNGSHDIAGIATMQISKTVFTAEDIGENVVTLTVTDKNGNTAICKASVFVIDNQEPPIVICRNIEVELDWKGEASITADQLDAGSSHTSGIAFTEISKNNFNIEHIGNNVVTLKVISNSGRIATCSATVTVEPKIMIYPNPTTEVLNVGVFTNFQFEIYNVLGQPVQKGEVNEKNNRIPLKVKISGTYFINFIKGDKKISKTFIIK